MLDSKRSMVVNRKRSAAMSTALRGACVGCGLLTVEFIAAERAGIFSLVDAVLCEGLVPVGCVDAAFCWLRVRDPPTLEAFVRVVDAPLAG